MAEGRGRPMGKRRILVGASFRALHASDDKRTVGGGHDVRLAREGRCVWQSGIDWAREGRDVGIIERRRRGVDREINRTQVNKSQHSEALNPRTAKKRHLWLSLLHVL